MFLLFSFEHCPSVLCEAGVTAVYCMSVKGQTLQIALGYPCQRIMFHLQKLPAVLHSYGQREEERDGHTF